jgi:putative NADH-flavin reductase
MKLLIFGATGGTGRLLVEQALEQGHAVTAFVRNPAAFDVKHKNLQVVKGDVLNADSVLQAMGNHEAVISAIGMPANKTGTLRSTGTLNIIRAMEKTGMRRLISLASLGYGDSRATLDRTGFFFKYIIVPFVLKKGFADHALQEQYIKESSLDWTIVRPGNLTDGPYTGVYKHGFAANDKSLKIKVSRADVADFMLKQVDSLRYLKKTPGVSY